MSEAMQGRSAVLIELPSTVLFEVVAACTEVYPHEACGLVVRSTETVRVIRIRNAHPDPASHFSVDPRELVEVFDALEVVGEQIVAIYHSHPTGPARPSPADVRQAHYPDAGYLVVSLADPAAPVIGAFRIVGGEIASCRPAWIAERGPERVGAPVAMKVIPDSALL